MGTEYETNEMVKTSALYDQAKCSLKEVRDDERKVGVSVRPQE